MFLTQFFSWQTTGISVYLNFWRKVKALIKVSQFAEKPAMGFFFHGIWSLVFCLHSPLGKNNRHFLCRSSLGFYQDRKCTSVHAFECLEWMSCSVQVQFHFITNLTHCDHLVSKEQKASHQLSDYSSSYSGLQIIFARRRRQRNNFLVAYLSRTIFKKEVKKD